MGEELGSLDGTDGITARTAIVTFDGGVVGIELGVADGRRLVDVDGEWLGSADGLDDGDERGILVG